MAGGDDALEHFKATLGQVPDSVATLLAHAPDAMAGYLALREYAHREPPLGLDAVTRELLFVSLDVAVDHGEAAKAHVEAALKAGATLEQVAQALVITMMIAGIATWSKTGWQVMRHAAEAAGRPDDTAAS